MSGNIPKVTREDREVAFDFFCKNPTGSQADWIERGVYSEDIDSDVIDLANLLSSYRNAGETRGFLSGLASVVKGVNRGKTT